MMQSIVALAISATLLTGTQPAPAHNIGDACIGAEVGMRAVDPNGKDIICDAFGAPQQVYHWALYVGQVPHHCSMGFCGDAGQ